MYIISRNAYANKEVTSKNKKHAALVSEEKFEPYKPKDGEICEIAFQFSSGIHIGVVDGDFITSGYTSTRHHGYLKPVDNVSVLILNTDGKQTGRELVGENIGNTFKLLRVNDNDKYKYVIEIEGKEIALSLDNIMFRKPETEIKKVLNSGFIKYRGVEVCLHDTRYLNKPMMDVMVGKCSHTGNTIYIMDNNYEYIDDSVIIGIPDCITDLIRDELSLFKHNDVVFEYGVKHLDFDIKLPVKKGRRREIVFSFYHCKKQSVPKIFKSLPSGFKFDNRNRTIYYNG